MTIEDLFVHTVDVDRPTHAKDANRQKLVGKTSVATGVRCRISAQADASVVSLIGRGQDEPWRAWFLPGSGLQVGDILTWTDRTPAQAFDVLTVQPVLALDPSAPHHLVVTLGRRA